MLADLLFRLSKCNPFDCLGTNVQIEDFFDSPLQSDETLVQGWCCHFRRVKVPKKQASFIQKFKFWISIHFSKLSHFEAINNMLFVFEQGVLQHPPKNIEDIQKILNQIETLKSLKNDYYISQSIINFERVDSSLNMIEQEAYALFSKNIKNLGEQEENKRKNEFRQFQKNAQIIFQYLNEGYIKSVMVSKSITSLTQFNELVVGIRFKIGLCHTLLYQIKKVELTNLGKFTLISLANDLDEIHAHLLRMLSQIESEIHILTENLKINFFDNSSKKEVSQLLKSSELDFSESKEAAAPPTHLAFTLNNEINEIKNEVKNSKKKYCKSTFSR